MRARLLMLWKNHLWSVTAMVICANLFVLAIVIATLETSYRQYQERAEVSARNANRVISQTIASEIHRIALGLDGVADEAGRQMEQGGIDAPVLQAFLSRQQARLPMVENIVLTDPGGTIINSVRGLPQAAISVADRDYFNALRNTPDLPLAISAPLQGRILGKWALIFARRLPNRPDGGFGGVVAATVAIDWFIGKLQGLEVGEHGVVVLRGDASRDFDLLARSVPGGFVGQTRVSPTFRERITANPREGSYVAEAGADNVRRVLSYEAVDSFPLVTVVGLATQDFLPLWRHEALKLGLLGAFFAVMTALFGHTTARSWRRLKEKTEELERSNADLERFAYVSSHDLQTPLRTIALYTQLLERRYRDRLDAEANEFIGYIVGAAQHMSRLITDLLNYARVSSQGQPLLRIEARTAVDTALGTLKAVIDECGAELSVGRLPVVMADQAQLASLFQNLIGNAIKYRHPDRKPRITVDAEADGGFWRFAVRDNGIGIDPRYFGKIFEIFQRLDPAHGPAGTGIGLAICQRIVWRFGGRIWVESQEGQGAAFFFTLPVVRASARSSGPQARVP